MYQSHVQEVRQEVLQKVVQEVRQVHQEQSYAIANKKLEHISGQQLRDDLDKPRSVC